MSPVGIGALVLSVWAGLDLLIVWALSRRRSFSGGRPVDELAVRRARKREAA